MVYLISDCYERPFNLEFTDPISSDWYHIDAGSQAADYRSPAAALTATLAVEDYAPDEPPAAFGAGYAFFCNDAFREIIEVLEPEVHDFVPMTLRYGEDQEEVDFPFYVVRPQVFIDALDVTRSDIDWCRILTGDHYWRKKLNVPLRLAAPLLAGKHLWRTTASFGYTLISNAVYREIHRQKLLTCWAFEKQILTDAEMAPALQV